MKLVRNSVEPETVLLSQQVESHPVLADFRNYEVSFRITDKGEKITI